MKAESGFGIRLQFVWLRPNRIHPQNRSASVRRLSRVGFCMRRLEDARCIARHRGPTLDGGKEFASEPQAWTCGRSVRMTPITSVLKTGPRRSGGYRLVPRSALAEVFTR